MSLLEDGQRIRSTYQVERFLGQGAFAEVYRVRHRFLGRQAMKVFKRIGTIEETEQMLGEAILLSQIGHPNIVRVFDADTVSTSAGQRGFFTMEYVAGGSLESFWVSHRDRFVPVESTVRILGQLCEGLAVAHSEKPPIIHRDITPQNILVGYDTSGLRARVSDFGLAKRTHPLTELASTRGTLAFKAPESLRNMQSDSCAGDVWAIGTIAYLLLTDTLPYEDPGGSSKSFLGAHHRTPPVSPQRFNSEVDEPLERIVLQALDPDPKSRTPDAGALAKELTGWQLQRRQQQSKKGVDLPPQTSKTVLGVPSPADEGEARRMATQALLLSRQASALQEAADLMEEAFNKSPELRGDYEHKLRLWRKGVVT
jgi:eukaryotic-like serine/threonine-protein kinase